VSGEEIAAIVARFAAFGAVVTPKNQLRVVKAYPNDAARSRYFMAMIVVNTNRKS